uniref:Uncharacterized protein n=1 Tax=Romanomermis culicivorax TaxID=13658 RepID=A0A915HMC6_ROMCU
MESVTPGPKKITRRQGPRRPENFTNSGLQFNNRTSGITSSTSSDLNSVAVTAAAFSNFCLQSSASPNTMLHHPAMGVLRDQCETDQLAIDDQPELSTYFESVPVQVVANSQQASMVDCSHSIVDSKDKSLSSDSGVNLYNQQTTATPFSFPSTPGFNFKLPYASTMSEPNLGYISSSTSTATVMQTQMTFPTVPTAVPFPQLVAGADSTVSPPFLPTASQPSHSPLNNAKATQTSLPEEPTVQKNPKIDAKINHEEASDQQKTVQGQGIDLNTQTESNHDTALTLACAGGHAELITLLLNRGANIEHQDKKGFTPLILAATAGHLNVVELLLQYGANPEAQSERTKDTALSLACSSGKKEVVELLLKKNVNKEHRNVSDYTPLSLAASGGYTDIISLLLQFGAEINSRTGSKLGISPLMLASMNGHVQAVKLLLEKSADINAQIETNRNTALTLACFQGRHEVVKLLLQYGANVEHRAKTGLTPLMEAASGGYVDVGRILLEYGADPNSSPVPSSRDTALTIAAEKGHTKFVDLLLQNHAQLDCKTKKGCSALWLASHGGFLEIVQALVKTGACPDAQDNRRVTPLMAAFRKCHFKVVKYLVRHVQQFPSDTDCTRYMTTITDKMTLEAKIGQKGLCAWGQYSPHIKDILARCKQCMEIIMTAKDRQAQEANKAAAVLLQELEQEQQLAETRRQAKIRQKEKKKAKRKAKKAATSGFSIKQDGDEDASDNEVLEDKATIEKGVEQSGNLSKEKSGSSSRSTSSRSSPGASVERSALKDATNQLENSLQSPIKHSNIDDKNQERVPSFATTLDVSDKRKCQKSMFFAQNAVISENDPNCRFLVGLTKKQLTKMLKHHYATSPTDSLGP